MKNFLVLLVISLLLNSVANAQIGINTTTPNVYAALDISSNNKGVLAPRVDLTSLTFDLNSDGDNDISNQPEGLLVYNTGSVLSKGYYYWSGTKWDNLSVSTDWNLNGTSDTNPSVNFLGTTDNKELWLRTNNINRLKIGHDITGASFSNLSANVATSSAYTGQISGINNQIDLNSGSAASNVFGIENLLYLRSGSTVSNTFRAQRNRIWNVNTANFPNVTGVLNEYRGEGTDISTFYGFQNTLDFRASSNTTDFFGFSTNFTGQVNGLITNYYGFFSGTHSSLGGVSNYYGYYQPNLGTAANRFAFYYKGNGTTTRDVVITGLGRIGAGTAAPHSVLQTEGSFSARIQSTGTATGIFTLNDSHYTVRLANTISEVTLPNPTTCNGRIYILVGQNGISSKNINVTGGSSVFDDTTNSNVTAIAANQRYQIQSDGTNWIVIGR
jgi:hypothetical protein